MEWLESINRAIDYIEQNLEGEIDLEWVGRVACYSSYHFQCMFNVITGMTVAEYIRRRRLTLAGHDLALQHLRVIDVALKYGYQTPEAFNKAFQRMHGISPSEARKPGVVLTSCPRLSFQITIIKGDRPMKYRIENKPSLKFVGKALRTTTKDDENISAIPNFWKKCINDGSLEPLKQAAGKMGTIGICMPPENSLDQHAFSYAIAIEASDRNPAGLESFELPASAWAIFESCGVLPDSIQNTWKAIFTEWFPGSGYEHAGTPDMEVYPLETNQKNDGNTYCEIWVPIRRKEVLS